MGSVGNVPNGISFVAAALGAAGPGRAAPGVTAPGAASGSAQGRLNSQDLEKILQSATPLDALVLSSAALQLQQVDGIFGVSPPAPPEKSFQTPGLAGNLVLPPGISSIDLANATPDQLATIAVEAQALEQHASLFTPVPAYLGNVNILG